MQTQFVQGGMEYPALVMISDNLESNAYGEVIVHETAHQWWQTVVGNNEIEYGFLDEGLAEYSVVIFFEAYPKYGITRSQMIKSAEQTYKIFCSVTDKLMGKVNTVMLRNLGEFSSEYATYLHNRGRAFQLQNKLDEAKETLMQSITLQNKLEGKPLERTVKYYIEVEQQLGEL